jgi:hypothetical protein
MTSFADPSLLPDRSVALGRCHVVTSSAIEPSGHGACSVEDMGMMRRPNDLRMLGKPVELVFEELDIAAERSRRATPPSREAKLRALDRLDRADTLARIREIAPIVLAVSSVVMVVLAVTRWARDR